MEYLATDRVLALYTQGPGFDAVDTKIKNKIPTLKLKKEDIGLWMSKLLRLIEKSKGLLCIANNTIECFWKLEKVEHL